MKAARIIEIAAWGAGIVLLGAYGGARYWYASASDAALTAFSTSRHDYVRRQAANEILAAPAATALRVPAPSTSNWSPQRIKEYRKHNAQAGTPDALLRIPALGLVVPVFDGTSERNLNRGAARIEGTARIGGAGNLGLAAHRDGFFRALKDIRIGDAIFVDQIAATRMYRVVDMQIVMPSDINVLRPTATPTLTLVTCYPFYHVGSAPKRFIVQARIERLAASEYGPSVR